VSGSSVVWWLLLDRGASSAGESRGVLFVGDGRAFLMKPCLASVALEANLLFGDGVVAGWASTSNRCRPWVKMDVASYG
jgi:hypothetical protein